MTNIVLVFIIFSIFCYVIFFKGMESHICPIPKFRMALLTFITLLKLHNTVYEALYLEVEGLLVGSTYSDMSCIDSELI